MSLRTFLVAVLLATLTGCGYGFEGGGSILPPDVRKIYVPIVQNSSAEAGLSALLTEALRDRFERFGVIQIVDSAGEADAVLKGRIIKVKNSTRSTTSTDSAVQYNVTMTLSIELKRVGGAVLWRNNNLQVTQSYGSTKDTVVTTSPEFAQGGLSNADLGQLDDREIQRGQESASLVQLSAEAARLVYDQAVTPDF